jgi:hypothetical protein
MSELKFRPWGKLDWLLGSQDNHAWEIIGALGPEDRAAASIYNFPSGYDLKRVTLLKIEDWPSRFTKSTKKKLASQTKVFNSSRLGASRDLISLELFASEGEIVGACRKLIAETGYSLIVDISSIPKRILFPLLVCACEDKRIRDLIAVYTIPQSYGQVLSEDAEPWKSLPMFSSVPDAPDSSRLIISVGYQPLNIATMLSDRSYKSPGVVLLFPFPSLPPGFEQNWRFVRQIEDVVGPLGSDGIQRFYTHDCSMAFDRLLSATNGGSQGCVLAPFGPKPCSLAMCLFGAAMRQRSTPIQIGYTQPKVYSPDYSSGVALEQGEPLSLAYAIRLAGREYYTC